MLALLARSPADRDRRAHRLEPGGTAERDDEHDREERDEQADPPVGEPLGHPLSARGARASGTWSGRDGRARAGLGRHASMRPTDAALEISDSILAFSARISTISDCSRPRSIRSWRTATLRATIPASRPATTTIQITLRPSRGLAVERAPSGDRAARPDGAVGPPESPSAADERDVPGARRRPSAGLGPDELLADGPTPSAGFTSQSRAATAGSPFS